ncbi:ribonuclease H-like domain-containing protein [Tanacetum coccineum]
MFLSQRKYVTEILERAGMVGCNSSRTHVDTESKLGDDVQQVCLYMHDPREPHFLALKRIMRYIRDTDWAGLPTTRRSTSGKYFLTTTYFLSPQSVNQRFPVLVQRQRITHLRTKHIEIDIHFVRDLVAVGQVRVLHVPSRYQFADIFTKGLPSALFEEFRTSLSVRCPPALTAKEC